MLGGRSGVTKSKMKNIFLGLCLAIVSSDSLFSTALTIEHKPLDNKNCTNGVSHRLWSKAWAAFGRQDRQGPMYQFIALHYTVCRTLQDTYTAYDQCGVSAHFTIANDGIVYNTVDPSQYIAYHAGASRFCGLAGLNYYAIGIEHVNPGYVTVYKEDPLFGRPVQRPGDNRWWYSFSEQQFVASATLTADLQRQYKIPGWCVVTHADIAPGRKSDIGPLWDYERAYREYSAGYWPEETHGVDVNKFANLSKMDFIKLICSVGYHDPGLDDENETLIRAYQMHYSPQNLSGRLDSQTKENVLKHVIGLQGHTDATTGQKCEYCRTELAKWKIDNPDKAQAFDEYFGE
jgi:N-acetyl-anhydromuramyl-L-alanine amidase AmpD